MARPSKLTQEIVDQAGKYLTSDQCYGLLPTIEGLAVYLNVARSSIYLWRVKKGKLGSEFSDILERIEAEQGMRLINGGLYGKFNATITKLMLTKHGYVDKQEVDHTTQGKPMPLLGGTTPLLEDDAVQSDNKPTKDTAA